MFWSVEENENGIVTLIGDDGSRVVLLQSDYDVAFEKRAVFGFASGAFAYDEAETSKRKNDNKKRLNVLFSRSSDLK